MQSTTSTKRAKQRPLTKTQLKLEKKIKNLRANLYHRNKNVKIASLKDLRSLVRIAIGQPCPYCQTKMTMKLLTIDHIFSLANGGHSGITNLQAICKKCNRMKGALNHAEFLELLDFISKLYPASRDDIKRRLGRPSVGVQYVKVQK